MEQNIWPGLSEKVEVPAKIPHEYPEAALPAPLELINPVASPLNSPPSDRQTRLFSSFQPQEEASEKAVEAIIRRPGEQRVGFVDRNAQVRLNWAGQLKAALRRADCLSTFLSPQTIHRPLPSVYSKSGVVSPTEAARYAHEHGLLFIRRIRGKRHD